MVKILVTGAAGFIGFHTARRLLARGDEVVGVDNFDPFYSPAEKRRNLAVALAHPRFRLVEADCAELPTLEAALDGDSFDVDKVLAEYDDWQDFSSWPRHPDEKKPERQAAKKMEDPHSKQGLVGAFCRCYTISQAIATFLPDVYEPVDESLTRYTYVHGTGHGGLVVYDNDTFAYSHHQSDPVGGREVNAFDLVRIHKFGHLDDDVAETMNITKLPSYAAMCAFAAQDPAVKRLMTEEFVSYL